MTPRQILAGWMVLAAGLAGTPCLAQSAPPPTRGQVTIPNTQRIDFVSNVNGHRYRIEIAIPFGPPPKDGYPVIYVLDGNEYFASATEAVRANGNAPCVLVVGIGYPDDAPFVRGVLAKRGPVQDVEKDATPFDAALSLERLYDLSLPAPPQVLAAESLPGVFDLKPANVGGVDDLLRTIETEVKPRVAKAAPINARNQALFGHSLGGLAVLRALFSEPAAFRTFIAASPSIWWGGRAILAGEAGFAAKVASGAASPRVLVTVGAEEDVMPTDLKGAGPEAMAKIRAAASAHQMVANARDLAARLSVLHGSPAYQVGDVAVFPHQGHGISPWPALGRAIEFAFQKPD